MTSSKLIILFGIVRSLKCSRTVNIQLYILIQHVRTHTCTRTHTHTNTLTQTQMNARNDHVFTHKMYMNAHQMVTA